MNFEVPMRMRAECTVRVRAPRQDVLAPPGAHSHLLVARSRSHNGNTSSAMLYIRLWSPLVGGRCLSGQTTAMSGSVKLHKALLLLGVSQHAEPQQVREAYIRLAKLYHPDSGSPQASNQKFVQVSLTTKGQASAAL